MSDTLAQWHTDHLNFAKLLNVLEAELDLFHKGDSPNYELMLDIMFYMTHYPDVLHHPREDLAFAKIKAREKSAGPTVDELSEQHVQLRKLGEELVGALSDIVNGSISSRKSVESSGRAYVASFNSHMRTEETTILPMAAKLLRAMTGPRSRLRFNTSTTHSSAKPRKSGMPRSISRSRSRHRPQRRRRGSQPSRAWVPPRKSPAWVLQETRPQNWPSRITVVR